MAAERGVLIGYFLLLFSTSASRKCFSTLRVAQFEEIKRGFCHNPHSTFAKTATIKDGGDGGRGGLGWLTVEELRSVVNRWHYVDLEAHAVKAHTQGGCEGAGMENQIGGGRGRGRGRMGQGGRGGHGSSHSGGQKEEVNGSGGRGVVREREDEDDMKTDDERGLKRRTDGDEGVEIYWKRTTGDARGEQRVGTRARGTGLEVTEDDGRGRPGRR